MPTLLLLRQLLLFLSLTFAAGQNLSSAADLAALFRLRASLALRARDWPRRADPCSAWAGVACDSVGRVISINLYNLRRTRLGRLNPRFAVEGIQNLTRLFSLNSTGFFLPGPIPNWFGSRLPQSIAVIDLRRSSISGNIPSILAGNLTLLSLAENSITGNIPPTISQLRNLSVLDLSSNFLTGSLGEKLFSGLTQLESVRLSRNNFSDKLPDSLWSLSKLRFLDVSHNNFTGNLPELSGIKGGGLTGGGSFNLSHNLLYGSISSGFAALLSTFNHVDLSDNYLQGSAPPSNSSSSSSSSSLSVKSNCFQNASSQRSRAECQEFYKERGMSYDVPSSSLGSFKSNNTWKYIVAAVVGGTALLVSLLICLLLCFWWRRRRLSDQNDVNPNAATAPEGGKEPPLPAVVVGKLPAVGEVFTFVQLARATLDFGEGNLIKHGKSGDIYQGVLENGSHVVVKRIDMNIVKKEACRVELDLFARFSHERLVPFVGHCFENENESEMLFVYRQMPNGNLANALYRKGVQEDEGLQSLDWITRLKIATGAAEGLCYLHHECAPPLVHRDIQASSILLDDKFEVRLGSLSNVCAQEGDVHQNVISRLLRLSQTGEESGCGHPAASWWYDVHCFGKVLLELVTGRLGVSGSNDPTTNEWVETTLRFISVSEKEMVGKIVDPSLIVDEDLIEEVWAMAIVAKSCLNPKPSKRPLMKYVLKALENPLKVVREDSNSESGRLKAASSRSLWNAGLFGSWRRSSSEIASGSAPAREERSFRRSGTGRSPEGSGGDRSFSGRRNSNEICPDPQP